MYYALSRALTRKKGVGQEIIWSDSLYTINMSTGKWMSRTKRNRGMVGLLRRTWRQLQRWRPGEVTLRHVRSHVLVPGNELADWLADAGRCGSRESAASAHRWLQRWRAERDPPPSTAAPGAPSGVRAGDG